MDPRTRLEDERSETLRRRASLTGDYTAVIEASRNDNADDEHDPEGATIAFERSQIGSLLRQVERQLGEIDAALERVASGSYGICETCGEQIGEGRLDARPTARTCVPCLAR